MTEPTKPLRRLTILIVEDTDARVDTLNEWALPRNFRLAQVRSAGAALGVLERVKPGDYAGAMLDFHLHKQPHLPEHRGKTGDGVARTMLAKLPPGTPILVHSNSGHELAEEVRLLEKTGFPVTVRPFRSITREFFEGWLDELREEQKGR